MTNLKIKVGDADIVVELDGCSADFDGKTLKIKADSVVNNVTENHYHHHYAQFGNPYPMYPSMWDTTTPVLPYTITCSQTSGGLVNLGEDTKAWNVS